MQTFLYIAVIFSALVSSLFYRHIKRHKALRAECLSALVAVYGSSKRIPGFEMSYAYGFPNFTITFQNKDQREEADKRGLNSLFVAAIGKICKDRGNTRNPFDAQQAVSFSYSGELAEFLAKK